MERDLFARSAYNRYYYAVFLAVREMVVELDPKWEGTAHKTYPDILGKSVAKKLKLAKMRAHKLGDYELLSKLDDGIRAANALAKLIAKAYGVRVVADYKLNEAVNFTSAERFSLKLIEVTEAHEWEPTARVLMPPILHAWRQLDA